MTEQILNFFVSNAYADTAVPASQGGPGMSLFVMFGIFFVFLYFTVFRPQSKRAKEQQNLLGLLAKGDEIITAGGM